jgi:hypothetical protein
MLSQWQPIPKTSQIEQSETTGIEAGESKFQWKELRKKVKAFTRDLTKGLHFQFYNDFFCGLSQLKGSP